MRDVKKEIQEYESKIDDAKKAIKDVNEHKKSNNFPQNEELFQGLINSSKGEIDVYQEEIDILKHKL